MQLKDLKPDMPGLFSTQSVHEAGRRLRERRRSTSATNISATSAVSSSTSASMNRC